MLDQTTARVTHNYRAISLVVFACLFAAQSGAVVLSPVLADLARDLDVSTAAAGQLRTIAGLVAGITALAVGPLSRRLGLGRQLLGGAFLLATGSLMSAVAPSIEVLAAAQVPVGAGIAILTTAGTLAAAEWAAPEHRTAVLSWALIGQPSAWIVGMPLVGAVGGLSWRYALLVLPLAAAIGAGVAVAGRRSDPPVATPPARLRATLAIQDLRRWLAAELLANTAWAATLVYTGSLLVESYDASTQLTGVALAVGASAYVAGNIAFRRFVSGHTRGLLVALATSLAAATTLLGAVRPSVVVSTALFSTAAFMAGGRTLVSSAFGLAAAAELRPGANALRGASMQFGYFFGSFTAGAALATGGYPAFGVLTGVLFLTAGVVTGSGWRFGPRRRLAQGHRPTFVATRART